MKEYLLKNNYQGRGIMIGSTNDGENLVIVYFIMGRSSNSRNRIFACEGENIKILPYDESKVEDPSLIIYYPLRVYKDKIIVTNGDQTDTIYDYLKSGSSFEDALRTRKYEPDQPNYTPRISGILDLNTGNYKLSILKKAGETTTNCARFFYEYEKTNGIGHIIHTYSREADSRMYPFCIDPVEVKVNDDICKFSKEIWDSLDHENKISLAIRYVNIRNGKIITRIINKHQL